VPGSSNYDAYNEAQLEQGAATLTLDFSQGEALDDALLLATADKARGMLRAAVSIENVDYDPVTGRLQFRLHNNTGHKLLSGFPEGRRMFVTITAFDSEDRVLYRINPYDDAAATLKGLPPGYSPGSPPLDPDEAYLDELVYEMHPGSPGLTGEQKTFHFVLATGRYKDNRIPPKGFRVADAPGRLCLPVELAFDRPDLYAAEEYAGGYDAVSVWLPRRVDRVNLAVYYQTTSREYIEFLRDEINGSGNTLYEPTPTGASEAYIVQTDPFFTRLRAWGDTVYNLWDHNRSVDGAYPFRMAELEVNVLWDSDKDTLPDAWELLFASDLGVMDATTDGDGDRFDDLSEFLADTAPDDRTSYLAARGSRDDAGGFVLRWPSSSNRVYAVDRTGVLPQGFSPVAFGLSATPPLNAYTDTTADAESEAYYRIRLER